MYTCSGKSKHLGDSVKRKKKITKYPLSKDNLCEIFIPSEELILEYIERLPLMKKRKVLH